MKSLLQALITIRRSPYQSLTALLMLTITFFVAYSSTLFLYGVDRTLSYFEQAPQVIAYFELDTDPAVIKNAEQTMQEKAYVAHTELITQEQALDIYREFGEDNPLLLELVTADFLPASLEISGVTADSLRLIADDLAQLPGIEEVQYQPELVDQLSNWVAGLRLTGLAVLSILAVLSFLVISIVIALKASVQKHTVNIVRVMGATKFYIASPYMLEGALYGLFGSLLGWGLMYLGFYYLLADLQVFLANIPVLPIPLEYFGLQLAIGSVIGMLFGSLAAASAVSRMIQD